MDNSKNISIDEIRHLARLTRIAMNDKEVDSMRDQMQNIIENIDILKEVDTREIEPTGHSVDLNSVMREDILGESLPVDDVLLNAPDTQENFIKIRPVFD
jgi:aspartyl-tRNA(Asn)/glutamyl-tRNA(Gln) amidotransferase subunit C